MSHRLILACGLLCAVALSATGCVHLENPVTRFMDQRRQHDDAQRQVARLQEHQGKLRKADELYEDLLKRDKNNVDLCHRLAIVASRQEDWPKSISYFDRAIKLSPNDAELRTDFGYALYLSGDLEAAEKALREALEHDAHNKRASNNLAIVLGDQERFDEAYEVFRRSLTEAEAHANIAYLYVQRGYGKKAVENYSRALELDPGLESAQNGMLQLAQYKQRLEETAGRPTAIAGSSPAKDCGTGACPISAHPGRTKVSTAAMPARLKVASSPAETPRNAFASAPSDATLDRARALFGNRQQSASAPAVQLAVGSHEADTDPPQAPFETETDGSVTQVRFQYAD